jgi:hypothetical protein
VSTQQHPHERTNGTWYGSDLRIGRSDPRIGRRQPASDRSKAGGDLREVPFIEILRMPACVPTCFASST